MESRSAPNAKTLTADLCIIGAGPAGLTLAKEVSGQGGSIVVLESGGTGAADDLLDLNAGEVAGEAYQSLPETRARGIGGTARIWNTNIHGTMVAKHVPLDALDFQARSWIPGSGWPFSKEALDPYYARAEALLGWAPLPGPLHERPRNGSPMAFPEGSLVSRSYLFGLPRMFTEEIPAHLRGASDVEILRGATMTEMVATADSGRVQEVHWRNLSGGSGIVRASNYVLAAGGIENARLLLASGPCASRNGEQEEWLGRGFMEHPVDRSLRLITEAEELVPDPGFYAPRVDQDGRAVMGRLGLSESLMEKEHLPNASIRVIPDMPTTPLALRLLRAAARRAIPLPAIRRWIAGIPSRSGEPPRAAGPRTYRLLVDLEQAPGRGNRITLARERDRLGVPRVRLQWGWTETDEDGRRRTLEAIARELERNGVGRVLRVPDVPLDPNSHHHAGSTRMHVDPQMGVVDPQLRVHGVENLFVVGSSVFPTAGFANPTLTTIALTLRLADTLKGTA